MLQPKTRTRNTMTDIDAARTTKKARKPKLLLLDTDTGKEIPFASQKAILEYLKEEKGITVPIHKVRIALHREEPLCGQFKVTKITPEKRDSMVVAGSEAPEEPVKKLRFKRKGGKKSPVTQEPTPAMKQQAEKLANEIRKEAVDKVVESVIPMPPSKKQKSDNSSIVEAIDKLTKVVQTQQAEITRMREEARLKPTIALKQEPVPLPPPMMKPVKEEPVRVSRETKGMKSEPMTPVNPPKGVDPRQTADPEFVEGLKREIDEEETKSPEGIPETPRSAAPISEKNQEILRQAYAKVDQMADAVKKRAYLSELDLLKERMEESTARRGYQMTPGDKEFLEKIGVMIGAVGGRGPAQDEMKDPVDIKRDAPAYAPPAAVSSQPLYPEEAKAQGTEASDEYPERRKDAMEIQAERKAAETQLEEAKMEIEPPEGVVNEEVKTAADQAEEEAQIAAAETETDVTSQQTQGGAGLSGAGLVNYDTEGGPIVKDNVGIDYEMRVINPIKARRRVDPLFDPESHKPTRSRLYNAFRKAPHVTNPSSTEVSSEDAKGSRVRVNRDNVDGTPQSASRTPRVEVNNDNVHNPPIPRKAERPAIASHIVGNQGGQILTLQDKHSAQMPNQALNEGAQPVPGDGKPLGALDEMLFPGQETTQATDQANIEGQSNSALLADISKRLNISPDARVYLNYILQGKPGFVAFDQEVLAPARDIENPSDRAEVQKGSIDTMNNVLTRLYNEMSKPNFPQAAILQAKQFLEARNSGRSREEQQASIEAQKEAREEAEARQREAAAEVQRQSEANIARAEERQRRAEQQAEEAQARAEEEAARGFAELPGELDQGRTFEEEVARSQERAAQLERERRISQTYGEPLVQASNLFGEGSRKRSAISAFQRPHKRERRSKRVAHHVAKLVQAALGGEGDDSDSTDDESFLPGCSRKPAKHPCYYRQSQRRSAEVFQRMPTRSSGGIARRRDSIL